MSAHSIDVPSKRAFGFLKKLEFAASNVACNTMKEAALEIRSNETDTEFSQCGVGGWHMATKRIFLLEWMCVCYLDRFWKGSSGAMEPLGVYRIFERSVEMRKLHVLTHTKACRNKTEETEIETKRSRGRGKLTDAFIDMLQNYYGIAIRDNVNNLQGMQRAVIAAFFHCCSNAKQQMHGQCPVGPDSWCKYQQAVSKDKIYIDKSKGLPQI
ncbi:uncharacterized protein TNCV_2540121 [Trichonephila clavipes]|nr:uncharacterized protein TNCV_2540121 [Trichonephila clavipes]